jgi:EAL domain-containing protein (putative c-di-GMP-specific phosphodiesterase class I)
MSDYDAIEEGLRNGEFFLEYLPTVELRSGRCIGGEALSRWRRPSGVVQPADFLPLMENTPLSGLLTYGVVEQIARDFLDWLKVHDAFIAINVPPEIIGRGGIAYVGERSGLIEVKDKIVFEITERGVPDRIAIETINLATQRGLRVALDDVGTGGANLLVLARCDVEMVKLDRHLVAQVRRGEPLPGNLEALAPLLKTGKLEVVAEGVETAEQAEVLKSAGVRLAQGFHFSRPLSADAFKTYFAERGGP